MKLIILLCVVSIVASLPVLEDTNQNWGLVIPPEPEYYDDDDEYVNRPISFDPITARPRVRKSTTTSTTTTTTTQSSVDPRPSVPLDMSLHPSVLDKFFRDTIFFRDDYMD